jgi:N-acetylneuraminic acid mutarotase
VEIYDPHTNRWSEGPSLPRAIYGMAAVLGPDDKIYVIGGDDNDGGDLNQVWTLDVRPTKPAGH